MQVRSDAFHSVRSVNAIFRGLVAAGLMATATACGDIVGPNERPLSITWMEFPSIAVEDSSFAVRVIGPVSGCDRVVDLRAARRDTVFVVSGLTEPTGTVCAEVLATLDTLIQAETGGTGRFTVLSDGRSFGALEVMDRRDFDPATLQLRGGGAAVPVRRGACVALKGVDGPTPPYPTTGVVSVSDTVAARGFVRGILLTTPAPPDCADSGLPLFAVESLDLDL